MQNTAKISKDPSRIKDMARSTWDDLLKAMPVLIVMVTIGISHGLQKGDINVVKNEVKHTNYAVEKTNDLITDHIHEVKSMNIPDDVSGKISALQVGDKETKVELKYFNRRLNVTQKDVKDIKNILINDHRVNR